MNIILTIAIPINGGVYFKGNIMLMFPKSRVDQFQYRNKCLRYGQAFHNFMKLHKCNQDRNFCDRLWNERSEERAKAMIASRTDPNN